METFQIFCLVVLIILALAIFILKANKNMNDDDESNNEEIKDYAFTAIEDIINDYKAIRGLNYDRAKKYIIDEASTRIGIVIDNSSSNINIKQDTIKNIVEEVIDANFHDKLAESIATPKYPLIPDHEEESTDVEEETTENVEEVQDEVVEETIDQDTSDEEVIESQEDLDETDDYKEESEGEQTPIDSNEESTDEVESDVEAAESVDEITEESGTDSNEELLAKEEVVEEAAEVKEHVECDCFECMKKTELFDMCKAQEIKVTTKMTKAVLIEKLRDNQCK